MTASSSAPASPAPATGTELRVVRLDTLHDPERVFTGLYGDCESAFWLDSSRCGAGRARFSFIGAAGPLGASVAYDVSSGRVRVERSGGVEIHRESIFDYLSRELERLRRPSAGLPFGFQCGFAGYFGYELKGECDGDPAHRSPTPDAAFVFADRLLAFDHRDRHTYLLCLAEPAGAGEAERWIADTRRRLLDLPLVSEQVPASLGSARPRLARPRRRYLEEIAACRRRLLAGESYEVCLTNRLTVDTPIAPLSLYRSLRRVNPAPYAALLRFGDLAVLSSSPECFLRIDPDRWVETRPIKGTSGRAAAAFDDARLARELAEDDKSRAENVTIVDLMRNDLGRVCETGTVRVPELMRVETYETVHQLVSSVRGRLREDVDAPGCVRACFPPGSMTGAPKKRTMEILDELEGEPRGVYSGAIGYLGLDGACELSVAIRTIVLQGGRATIGAGGAIVLESDPDDEYEEMLLKAAAPLRAIDAGATSRLYPLSDPRRAADSPPSASAHDLTS